MEASLERCLLGILPVTKRVMWNPVPRESSIDQPIELFATIPGPSGVNKIKNPQQGLQFTASGD
jgi:hypothetical protein